MWDTVHISVILIIHDISCIAGIRYISYISYYYIINYIIY